MDVSVPFTDNYSDLSTPEGHQFEFFCQRCGNGYKSSFKTSAVAKMGSKATQGLGGMFGGRLSKVASQADSALHSVADAKGQDKAFAAAVTEVSPQFHRCNQCRSWVCDQICWDDQYELCVTCAADERANAANDATRSAQTAPPPQFQEVAQKMAEVIGTAAARQQAQTVSCASCGAAIGQGTKFCPECGQPIATTITCSSCGKEAPAGTKFCPECGTALS